MIFKIDHETAFIVNAAAVRTWTSMLISKFTSHIKRRSKLLKKRALKLKNTPLILKTWKSGHRNTNGWASRAEE